MRCRLTDCAETAAEALRAGGVVALPTETVYGLGAAAFNPQAVAQIFAVKQRPEFDPLIVHLAGIDWLPRVAAEIPPLAKQLADRFWPGPLTLVLPKTAEVPDLVTSGLATVGIRVPDHPLMQEVLRRLDAPIAAPSANLFGRLSPTTTAHVLEQLGDRIELVLEGGPCRVGIESTIVQFEAGKPVLLRPGGVSLESLEETIGPVQLLETNAEARPVAPGRLLSHYAPQTPIHLVNCVPAATPDAAVGVLLWQPRDLAGYGHVEILSHNSDLTEAAVNFFPALHRLDGKTLRLIVAELFPEQGLGRALNDRLRRAAAAFEQ